MITKNEVDLLHNFIVHNVADFFFSNEDDIMFYLRDFTKIQDGIKYEIARHSMRVFESMIDQKKEDTCEDDLPS